MRCAKTKSRFLAPPGMNILATLGATSLASFDRVDVDLLDAVGGGGDVNLRLEPRLSMIFCGDVLLEGVYGGGFDEIDRAAAEAAAGHPRADDTGLRAGNFDHEVEFLAADFVIVAQAAMRVAHQATKPAEIAAIQSENGLLCALVFGDDMSATRVNRWIQQRAMVFQLSDGDVPESMNIRQDHAQGAYTFFALGTAAVVFAGRKLVLHHGVADHELHSGGQAGQLKIERAAIEQQSKRSFSMTGDELVHDSAVRAHELVLGFLAKLREFGSVDGAAALLEQGETNGYFDGSRGTEACAQGDVAADEKICTVEALPCRLEFIGNAQRIVRPLVLDDGRK